MSDPIVVFTGATGQKIDDVILVGGKARDLTSDGGLKFKMRHADSDVLKVDADGVKYGGSSGKVYYQWIDDDLNEPGEYYFWWHLDLDTGFPIDTPETLLIVPSHRPGRRIPTGAIYQRARGILPVTWTVLEDSPRYGDRLLQDRIEVCKLNILGAANVAVDDEDTLDIRVQDYIGKYVALWTIPAGIDYWLDQKETLSTGGGQTNEIISFPDRIKALEAIQERLLAEIAKETPTIEAILGTPTTVLPSSATPEFSPGQDDGFVTPLPNKWFPDYHFPQRRPNSRKGNLNNWDSWW